MRKYDHLFFDLDNTLWDFTANSRLAMKETMDQSGILPEPNSFDAFFEVYERINKSLWSYSSSNGFQYPCPNLGSLIWIGRH
jgi:putative hydrolase of the HAD superfamily